MDKNIKKHWLGDQLNAQNQPQIQSSYVLDAKDVEEILTDFTKCLKESEKFLSKKCTIGINSVDDINDSFYKFIEIDQEINIPPDLKKLIEENGHDEKLNRYLYGLIGYMHSITQEIAIRYKSNDRENLNMILAHAIMNNNMIGSLNVLSESFINILYVIEKEIDHLGINSVTKLRTSVTDPSKNVKILAKDRENLIELVDQLKKHVHYTITFTRYIVLYFDWYMKKTNDIFNVGGENV